METNMFITGKVTECDFTQREYAEPVYGAHCISQGATGRFCCVMYAGPEYLRRENIKPISRHEAIEKCLDKLAEQQLARTGKKYSRLELDAVFIDF
jgi:hypothetical protein